MLEYQKNYEHLTELIGEPSGHVTSITATIAPRSDYSWGMKIDIGFRSDMSVKEDRSHEIPRRPCKYLQENAAMKVTILAAINHDT